MKNSVKVTPYFIRCNSEDGASIAFFETKGELFHNVCETIAFSDIMPDVDITEISCEGEECYYAGWKPGMRMVFKKSSNKEVVWDCSYPEWDH